jgi:hypothetical protein
MKVKLWIPVAVVMFCLVAVGPAAQAQVGTVANYCYVTCVSDGDGKFAVEIVESAVAEQEGIKEGDPCPGAVFRLLNSGWRVRGRDLVAKSTDGNGRTLFSIFYEFELPTSPKHRRNFLR